jgi:hypothetical protein
MVVNSRVHEISRGARKLVQTLTLIIIKKTGLGHKKPKKKQQLYIYNFLGKKS